MQNLSTVLTFLGAIAGAMIGATVAPIVQWQIEKRRQRMTYRRELISRWRTMLEKFNDRRGSGLPDEDLLYMLTRDGDFIAFNAYSTIKVSQDLLPGEKEFLENSEIHPLIYLYFKEVARLEKVWKLL
jgi:hypothetical protein